MGVQGARFEGSDSWCLVPAKMIVGILTIHEVERTHTIEKVKKTNFILWGKAKGTFVQRKE